MTFRQGLRFALVSFAIGSTVLVWVYKHKHKPKPEPILAQPVAGMYSNMRTFGEPFAFADGALDTLACQEQARYDVVIIDPEMRDVPGKRALEYIRGLAPKATMLGYFAAGGFYVCGPGWYGQEPAPYGCDTTTISYRVFRCAQDHHAILFDLAGNPLPVATGIGVDFAADGFPDALSDLIAEWVKGSGGALNGAFCDGPCESIAGWWPGNQTDYRRAGFETLADWDSAYMGGVQEFYRLLQERVGLVVGNCGPHGPYVANGWMGENFPFQNPASWAAWDSVLTLADSVYTHPQLSFITTPRARWQDAGGWHVQDFQSAEVQRQLRFILGSAALHDRVVGVVVGSPFDPLKGFMPDQWSDLYHSLGVAVGKQEISGVVHRREFSATWLLVNPTGDSSKQMVDSVVVMVPAMDAVFLQK